MTTEQHFADDGDIKQLSLDETRSAAKQLLDSVEGDLTGDVAQRFQALTRHAEELRAEQRRRGREAEEALRRCRAGELRWCPVLPPAATTATRRRATRCATPRFAHWTFVCAMA